MSAMRATGKLTDAKVRSATEGNHCDGAGLYLCVKPGAGHLNRSWLFRYTIADTQRWMGLGPYPTVTLARAREKAMDARRLLADGNDPLTHKRAVRASLRQRQAKETPTFAQCAAAYIASHEAGWRAPLTTHHWVRTLRDHVHPVLGRLCVDEIATEHVLAVLKPLWATKSETATQVRGRIEQVLDYARVLGHRSGENPARWRGHLDHLLPPRAKVAPVQHHRALHYREVPSFVDALRQREGSGARCLEFAILTACRSAEAIGARWSEIDLEARTWTIPSDRTKTAKEHRVPLIDAALSLLRSLPRVSEYVFPGRHGRQSHATLRALLGRMGCEASVHGFRASFSTWARETTSYPRELVEAALGHVVGDRTEQAYSRGDALERRRQLMAAWANHCTSTGAEVISLRNVS